MESGLNVIKANKWWWSERSETPEYFCITRRGRNVSVIAGRGLGDGRVRHGSFLDDMSASDELLVREWFAEMKLREDAAACADG